MSDLSARTLIVVDEDGETRARLECELGAAGYHVRSFTDGHAAIEPITELGSGIVISDCGRASMNGLQLCRALRELEDMQALGAVYFIMLSRRTAKDDVVAGLTAGANDYLSKPHHPGELLARVRAGERVLRLQEELRRQTIEFQKANLELALLGRKLDELAHTDTLTGLANRRCLFARFHEAWATTARNGQPLTVVMLDIDRFKRINDTYGHEAGDEVLRAAASRIRSTTRPPELCGRLGGEEFALVCPNDDQSAAIVIAESIREALAASPVRYGDQVVPVTLSCGVAERGPDADSPDALLRQADDMLYAAKEHGRNQTWLRTPRGGVAVDRAARRPFLHADAAERPLESRVRRRAESPARRH